MFEKKKIFKKQRQKITSILLRTEGTRSNDFQHSKHHQLIYYGCKS